MSELQIPNVWYLLRLDWVEKGKTCPPPIFLCISNSPDG